MNSSVNYTIGKVVLAGNVTLPGDYPLNRTRTLRDLLPSAEAFLPLTYTPFAFIVRLNRTTLQREVIPFSVQQAIEGKFNIDLQSQDVVHSDLQRHAPADRHQYRTRELARRTFCAWDVQPLPMRR